MTINVKTQFNAVGDGVTDDTAALQAGLNYLTATGGNLYIPAGVYRITAPLTANFTNSQYNSIQYPSITGDGSGCSLIAWDGANVPAEFALSITRKESVATAASAAFSTIQGIGFIPIGPAKLYWIGGLYISKWPFMNMVDVRSYRMQVGMQLDQVLSSNFTRLNMDNNNYGLLSIGVPASPGSPLYGNNALTFTSCTIGGNNLGGALMQNCSFQFIGGSVEDNGWLASGNGGYGMKIGSQGGCAPVLTLMGVYFEGNGTTGNNGVNNALADCWIDHSLPTPFNYNFIGCYFNRLKNNYAPFGIYINKAGGGAAALTMVGNSFYDDGLYTPSSARPYILAANNGGGAITPHDSGNQYLRTIETPAF